MGAPRRQGNASDAEARTARFRTGMLVAGLSAAVAMALFPGPASSSGPSLGNLVVTVPGDFSTVQQAIDAVQGSAGAEIRIATNGTIDESLLVTRSVHLRAAPGFSPTVRGVGATGTSTLRFRPNVAAGAPAAELRLSGLRLVPRASLALTQAYCVLDVENSSAGVAEILVDSLTIDDPLDGGPDGFCVRSDRPATAAHVRLLSSSIDLAGGEGSQTVGLSFDSRGTLFVSGLALRIRAGRATGFDVRGPIGQGLDFWLEGSQLEVTGPANEEPARLALVSGTVDAAIRQNEIYLRATTSSASVGGIESTSGNAAGATHFQRLAFEQNLVIGPGEVDDGILVHALPSPGGAFTLAARGNRIDGVPNAFRLAPQSGDPGATIDAEIVHNTIRHSARSAIEIRGPAGSEQTVRIANNILAGTGAYGVDADVDGTLHYSEHHNGFFENASGPVAPPFATGPGAFLGDPLFAAPSATSFRLRPDSPLVDAGSDAEALCLARDARDDLRRTGRRVDVGAYELGSPCVVSVTASHPGRNGTAPAMAFDLWRSSAYDPAHTGQMWLDIDFGCLGSFTGFRRFITADGFVASGVREFEVERVSTSLDGVQWTPLLATATTGWESYAQHDPSSWYEVPNGWSNWLRSKAPVPARFVRFTWQGDGDRLHEVELLFGYPAPFFVDGFEDGSSSQWTATAP